MDVQLEQARYLESLLARDETKAFEGIKALVTLGWRLETIHLEIIAKAMAKTEHLVRSGKLTTVHENQVAHAAMRQISMLSHYYPPLRKTELHAVISNVGRGNHVVQARIFSDLLTHSGWNVCFLGGGTPPDDLHVLVAEQSPNLAVLFARVENSENALQSNLDAISATCENILTVVSRNSMDEMIWQSRGAGIDVCAVDPLSSIDQINRIFNVTGAGVPLEVVLVEIGERIKVGRTSMGWSPKKLAEIAGIDRAYVSSVERGKQNCTLGGLKKITDALNISVTELLSPSCHSIGNSHT